MTGLRRALTVIAGAAILFGLAVIPIALSSSHQDLKAVYIPAILIVSWSFIGTGIYAWWRRPQNRIGLLMCLTGFSWLTLGLSASDTAWVFIVGFTLPAIAFGFLTQLLLSFPDGRLETRLERSVVIAVYLIVTVFQLAAVLFSDTTGSDFQGGPFPANPLLIADNETALLIITRLQAAIGITAIIGFIVALVRRWRRWNEPTRQAFTPVLWAGGIAISIQAVSLAAAILGVHGVVESITFVTFLATVTFVPYAYLVGMLRVRLSQADAVGELVTRLTLSRDRRRDLVEEMAEAMADPGLEIAYWIPGLPGYVDPQGVPVTVPEDPRRWTPVAHDDRPIAVLLHGSPLEDGGDNARRLAAAAALNLENERLEADLRVRVRELRASRIRLVDAGDAERTRVERNLHDGAQQRLVSLALNLRMARSKIEQDPDRATLLLDEASHELELATRELRELARGIHPAILSDRGLVPALESLASRATVPVKLEARIADRPVARVESAAYYVVSEALTNIARHAGASSAEVSVTESEGEILVAVLDDGRGGADPEGPGLRGLADRVGAADGTLLVTQPSGGGTLVTAVLPADGGGNGSKQ